MHLVDIKHTNVYITHVDNEPLHHKHSQSVHVAVEGYVLHPYYMYIHR